MNGVLPVGGVPPGKSVSSEGGSFIEGRKYSRAILETQYLSLNSINLGPDSNPMTIHDKN